MKKLFAVIFSLSLILAPVPSVSTAHAGGSGGYAKMILGLANGIVGTVIITNCRDIPSMTFDHYIYMAGSLVYIAGEILTGKKKGSDIDSNNKAAEECKAKMVEGGDYQRCTLEAQKKDEESTKEFIDKKMKWTKATLVVYSLAAVATGVEIVCGNIVLCKPYMDSMLQCNPSNASAAVQYGVVAAFGFANGGLMGAAMAAGMKAFAGMLKVGTATVDKLTSAMSTGYYRLGFYIAAGVLVGLILSDLSKQKQESEKRIAEIQKVIDTLEAADNNLAEGASTSGTAAGATSGALGGGDNQNGPKKYEVKSLVAGTKLVKNCWSNSSGTTSFSESGCSSPIRLQKPNFPGGVNIPTLNEGSAAAIDMANAISSGDIASADIQAGKLTAMAGRVDKIKDELIGKINADLVKNGKRPIDGKDVLKQQIDGFNAAMNSQNPGSGNLNLADFQNGAGDAAVSATTPAAEVPAATAVSSPVADISSGDTGIDLSKLEADALSGSEVVDPNAANGKVASLEDSLNQYESNENDISSDPGVSIFKQVSNRYILNYGKIFQRKQITPPLAEPQPSN